MVKRAERTKKRLRTSPENITPHTNPLQIHLRNDPFPLLVHNGPIRRDIERDLFGGEGGEVERFFVHYVV